MKKFLAALVALSILTGCASNPFTDRINLFASVQNPVSKDDFYLAKTAYAALALPVANYRELPLCKKSKPFSLAYICAKRSVIVKLQELDTKAYDALATAEAYINSNQTLNLASLISAAKIAVNTYKKYAADNGVTI
jgi:hypothetical protein